MVFVELNLTQLNDNITGEEPYNTCNVLPLNLGQNCGKFSTPNKDTHLALLQDGNSENFWLR